MKEINLGKYQLGTIFACCSGDEIECETFISEHTFTFVVTGTRQIWIGNKIYHSKAGDCHFIRKNQILRYTQKPSQEGFKALSITFDQLTLKNISADYKIYVDGSITNDKLVLLNPNKYFNNYFNSLEPYIKNTTDCTDRNIKVVALKIKELILLLIETNPFLKNILFDFSEPGKIDLEAFMNEHYRYNAKLSKYAYLTGRSLSTFKRDFAKTFHTTPNKWLIKRRLEEANYLIKKNKKPSDIYLDLGFKDLSHFSFAYKKEYGSSPSKN